MADELEVRLRLYGWDDIDKRAAQVAQHIEAHAARLRSQVAAGNIGAFEAKGQLEGIQAQAKTLFLAGKPATLSAPEIEKVNDNLRKFSSKPLELYADFAKVSSAARAVERGNRSLAQAIDAETDEHRKAALQGLQSRLDAKRQAAANQALINQVSSGQLAGIGLTPADVSGTRFQRFLAGLRTRQTGSIHLPSEQQSLSQFVQSKAITTAGFALSGALLYGSIAAVRNLVEEAKELESQFAILGSQMEALGRGDDLEGLQTRIFGIARNTGLTTVEVTRLAQAFVGAFVSVGPAAVEAGAAATDVAAQIARVADLEPGEIFNDLVAGMKAFTEAQKEGETGESFAERQVETLREVGDIAIQLRNVTGVAPKEIVDFLGRVGPIAKTAGLNLNEAAAAAATLLQGSSVGGAALGEQFGRILTSFNDFAIDIAEIAQAYPQIEISPDEALQGDPSVLFRLAEGFQTLAASQQRQIIQSIGSRREGATLATFLQNAATATTALEQAENSEGRVATELQKKKATLAQQMKELNAAFEQFGLALFQIVGPAIKGAVGLFQDLATILGGAANIVNFFARGLEVLPARLRRVALEVGVLVGALRLFGALRGRGGPTGAALNVVGAYAGPAVAAQLGARAGFLGTARGLLASGGTRALLAGGGLRALGSAGLASLGGPWGIAAAAAFTLGPPLISAIMSRGKKPVDQMRERYKQLVRVSEDYKNATDKELGIFAAELDQRVEGGDTTQSDELQKVRDEIARRARETEAETRKRQNEQKRKRREERQKLRDFARVGALEELGYITPETADDILDSLGRSPDSQATKDFRAAIDKGQLPKARGGRRAFLDDSDVRGALDPEALAKAIKVLMDQLTGKGPATGDEKVDQALTDLDTALAQYDVGDESLANLNRIWEKKKAILERAVELAPEDAEKAKTLAKNQREVNKRNDEAARAAYDLDVSIAELSGNFGPEERVAKLRALRGRTADPGERAKIAQEIAQAQRDLLDDMVEQADSAAEAARILREGIPLDREVKVDLVYAQLTQTGGVFQAFLGQYVTSSLAVTDAMYQQVADFVASGKTVAEALRLVISAQLEGLRAAAAFGANVFKQYTQLENVLAALDSIPDPNLGLTVPGNVKGTPEDVKAAEEKAAEEAKREALARLEVLKATYEGDPVKQAMLAQKEADIAAQYAKGTAEKLEAQAARIRANRQLEDAMREVMESRTNLLIAVAQGAGDTVRVAELQLENAQRVLNDLLSTGGIEKYGETAINNAKAAVESAQDAADDAEIQKQLDDIQFKRDMDQITDSQEVSLLKTILTLPTLDEDMRRDIERRIHEIEKSASADLQFNLPSELHLPTLYEARRLEQSGGNYNTSGYQDNRVITLNMQISSNNPEEVANTVINKFNEASRYGYRPSILRGL